MKIPTTVVTLMAALSPQVVSAQPMHPHFQVIHPTAPLVSLCEMDACLDENDLLSNVTAYGSENVTENVVTSLLSLLKHNESSTESTLPLPDNRLKDTPIHCSGSEDAYCYGGEKKWRAENQKHTESSSSEHRPRQIVLLEDGHERRAIQISSNAVRLEGHRDLVLDEIGEESERSDDAHDEADEDGEVTLSGDEADEEDDEYFEDDTTPGLNCTYREDWMDPKNEEASFFPSSCDAIHEIDPFTHSLINCGSSRCAFQVPDELGSDDVVIKIGMFNNVDYEEEVAYANAWKDTVILERLGWSSNILRLYGSCGTTQITEVAAGGNLLDFINVARQYSERSQTPPETKLKMAFHIMSAAADIHQLVASYDDEDDESPWMVAHNDFFPHQMLIVDGRIKLNDFHLASFAKKREWTHQMCLEVPTETDDHFDKTRAPEEIRFWYPVRTEDERYIDRSKVDVWYAGQSLYHILTTRWMFEGMERNGKVLSALRRDKAFDINLPEDLQEEYPHPAEQAIIDAIEWVWTKEFWERPTAREVADYLEDQLEEIYGEENNYGGLWRFDIPPLPEDYSFATADEEYHNNLGCPLDDAACIQRNRDAMDDWSVTVF